MKRKLLITGFDPFGVLDSPGWQQYSHSNFPGGEISGGNHNLRYPE